MKILARRTSNWLKEQSDPQSLTEKPEATVNHYVRMLLGCVLPMALIFVLPLFGVSEGISFTVFLVLMLACHLLMTPSHLAKGSSSPK